MVEFYLGLGGPKIELVESWFPVDVSRLCVLSLKFLRCVIWYLWVCLLLWVNFVCVGCWLSPTKICTSMKFVRKLHWPPHLPGGEIEAADMQHLHQSRWARESKSLYYHLLLHPHHLIMIGWKFNPFTFYLHWLDIGISIWSLLCLCCLDILMVASVLACMYLSWCLEWMDAECLVSVFFALF